MISNFLSNRINLLILQVILYLLLGNIMGSHLEWREFVVVFIIILGLQFITHIKAIADGMLMNQIMNENNKDFKKFIKKIKQEKNDGR